MAYGDEKLIDPCICCGCSKTELAKLRAEVEALKQGMEDCVKQAWKSGYEAGHDHTVEGEWGYAEERAADWFSDSMFSNWTQHLNSEGEK